MATLYELTNDIIELTDLLGDPDANEEDVKVALDEMKKQIFSKFDGYMKARVNLMSQSEEIDNEIKRLQERKKVVNNKKANLEKALLNTMLAIEQKKIQTALFTATVCSTAGNVVIDDEDEIPKEFIKEKIETKIDKKGIAAYLKENDDVEWAHIEKGNSIRFK